MTFHVGEKAFYPSLGVCLIKSIESSEQSGVKQDFYVLEPRGKSGTLKVSTQGNVCNLRKLSDSSDLEKTYSILRSTTQVVKTNWNRRQKEFRDRIRSGSLIDLATVARDIAALKTDKGLSSGAKDLMFDALNMMAQEIGEVSNKEHQEVMSELQEILAIA